MRILGLDVGTKTIGVAISDPLGWTAQGLETIQRKGMAKDIEALLAIIRAKEVEKIVIGLPLHMQGGESVSAMRARELGQRLGEESGLEIIYQDERLSTVSAQRVLLEGDVSRAGRKEVIDKVAAGFILQSYLDALANKN